VIDDPNTKKEILKCVAQTVGDEFTLTSENFPGHDGEELATQARLAVKSGLLDARADPKTGHRVRVYMGGPWYLYRPVVTASGRAYLRMRAPFWWVRFSFKSRGFWAGMGSVLVIPVSIILLIIRGILVALRVKFVLPD